jgi:predicted ester cyclase
MGVPPTNKEVSWRGINMYRIADGRLAETWQLADMLGVLRQIGGLPAR